MKTVTCYSKSLCIAARPLNVFVLCVLFSMMLTPSFSQCTLTKESCSITYLTTTNTSAISGSEWDGERICLQDDLILNKLYTGLYFIKMKLKNGTERSEVISIISNN